MGLQTVVGGIPIARRDHRRHLQSQQPAVRILPLGCLVIPMKSRAFLFIPFWFLLQLYGALAAPPGSLVGGVAWYAHLAGFAAGPILLFLLRRR